MVLKPSNNTLIINILIVSSFIEVNMLNIYVCKNKNHWSSFTPKNQNERFVASVFFNNSILGQIKISFKISLITRTSHIHTFNNNKMPEHTIVYNYF